jgi:PhoD-like phosphatase
MSKRARDGLGVYGVKLFDFARPQGRQALSDSEAGIDPHAVFDHDDPPSYSKKSVAVFVLDVRSNKSPWKKGLQAFTPDLEGDFLGEMQWEWFEAAISRSRAAINVVVNGLQVHANIFPDGNMAESWGKYPKSQQRLFDALLQDSVSAPILISGDVHMAQFMRKDCKRGIGMSQFRPLVEMTTSGMTHSWGSLPSNPIDSPDWKPTIYDRYGSFVAASLMVVLNNICPWTDVMRSTPLGTSPKLTGNSELAESGGAESAKIGRQFSLQKNFGELEFDWDMQTVSMRAIGEDEAPLLSAKWTMDQLSGRTLMPGSFVSRQDYANAMKDSLADGAWTCVNHRGRVNEISHLIGHMVSATALILFVPFPFLLLTYLLVGITRRCRTRATVHQKCLSHCTGE